MVFFLQVVDRGGARLAEEDCGDQAQEGGIARKKDSSHALQGGRLRCWRCAVALVWGGDEAASLAGWPSP